MQIFPPDLTSAQCYEVLEAAQENFDASLGINWTVLVGFAQALYPLAEDEHETIAAKNRQAVRWAEDWIHGRFSGPRERQRPFHPADVVGSSPHQEQALPAVASNNVGMSYSHSLRRTFVPDRFSVSQGQC